MRKLVALFAALVLASCSSSGSSSSCSTPLCAYSGLLAPTSGWTDYGTGTGAALVGRLSNPFTIPTKASGSSVNYVYTAPLALAAGRTITLNYSVDGNATLAPADPSDVAPATIALFIWAANDNGTTNFGRMWCPKRPNLVLGDNQTYSCVINSSWTGAGVQSGVANTGTPSTNAFAVGFTLGGQYFAGHGVWATGGSATFKVNSYSVQ